MSLAGKRILVGVSGGVAAYKAVEVVSRLKKAGAVVEVLMTQAARHFVQPLTFQSIAGNPVHTDLLALPDHDAEMHIQLAERADLYLIAPATADLIAKLAHGLADDFVTAVALATPAPVLLCPAMNRYMWSHPATQDNLQRLQAYGYQVLPPVYGALATGAAGWGRLPEPTDIVSWVEGQADWTKRLPLPGPRPDAEGPLRGIRVLVTAGPTREPIDPVRYLTNRSSGKMGFAVAKTAHERGAQVFLVAGPTSAPAPPGPVLRRVETAAEMLAVCLELFPHVDVVVKAAAVADYRPGEVLAHKRKKSGDTWELSLVRTDDILAELARRKTHQLLVGFAAETDDGVAEARRKLVEKNLDLVVLNDVTQEGAGFDTDTNLVKLVDADGVIELPLMTKPAVAGHILDRVQRVLAKDTARGQAGQGGGA